MTLLIELVHVSVVIINSMSWNVSTILLLTVNATHTHITRVNYMLLANEK